MRTLSRKELTAAHAARQMLLERQRLDPVEAIRRLTPLQGQEPSAPYVALAARLEGFDRARLEGAVTERQVVRTTIMRLTLHLAAADEYPAYAELSRQPRMRAWRKQYAHLDEPKVEAELRKWLKKPRTNAEIRERITGYEGVPDDEWGAVWFARNVLPLVQVPPAGHFGYRGRLQFVVHEGKRPDPVDAAALAVRRYLAAFGPASRRDIADWAGIAQRDFKDALERIDTVSFRDEKDTELLDLPDQPLPPARTKLPVRLLSRWDQSLLAYEDRDRIIPPEVQPLKLTLSGDQTITVDGRVAASWKLERRTRWVKVVITPHTDIRRSAWPEIRAEAERTARFLMPEAERVEVAA